MGKSSGLDKTFDFKPKEIDYQDAQILSSLKETIQSSLGKYNLQKQEVYGKGKPFSYVASELKSGFLYKNKEQELFLKDKVKEEFIALKINGGCCSRCVFGFSLKGFGIRTSH